MLVCLEFQSDFFIKSKFRIIWWFSVISNIICLLNTAQIQFIKKWDWNFKKLTLWALAGSAVIWNFPSTQRQITCWGCVQKPWNRESKDLQRESSNRSTVWSEQNLESFQNLDFRFLLLLSYLSTYGTHILTLQHLINGRVKAKEKKKFK